MCVCKVTANNFKDFVGKTQQSHVDLYNDRSILKSSIIYRGTKIHSFIRSVLKTGDLDSSWRLPPPRDHTCCSVKRVQTSLLHCKNGGQASMEPLFYTW
ncbi:hypothetical protein WAI453_005657 [Rhynchosporium graminicola]